MNRVESPGSPRRIVLAIAAQGSLWGYVSQIFRIDEILEEQPDVIV